MRDACETGDQAAGERARVAIEFAGDALLTNTDEMCSILNAGN